MSDLVRRFFFIAVASVGAYLLLHVLRSFGVEPEVRGIWAGATGYMLGDLAMTITDRKRRKRS